MKIWDYYLVRIAGRPFSNLDALCLEKSARYIEKIIKTEAKISEWGESISESLYKFVQQVVDQKELLQLAISLRRDVYNGRPIQESALQQLRHEMDSVLYDEITNFQRAQANLNELRGSYRDRLPKELKELRGTFREVLDNDKFKSGVLLGSSQLCSALEHYLQNTRKSSKEKDELGFIKYYSRMVAKTSPFSTFTNLSLGAFNNTSLTLYEKERDKEHSLIRLNVRLLKYFMNVLWQYYPFYKHVPVRFNSTVEIESDKYVYLLNAYNNEAFQEVGRQPLIDFLLTRLSDNSFMPYAELVADLESNVDSTVEELTDFIDNLLTYGLLEFEFTINGHDSNWSGNLVDCLDTIVLIEEDSYLKQLSHDFRVMNGLCAEYGVSNYSRRLEIQKTLWKNMYQCFLNLHKAADLPEYEREIMENFVSGTPIKEDRLKKHNEKLSDRNSQEFKRKLDTILFADKKSVLFEDTGTSKTIALDSNFTNSTIKILNSVCKELHFANVFEDAREQVRYYFQEQFSTRERVPILEFYRSFYAKMKAGTLVNPVSGPELMDKWNNALRSALKQYPWNEDEFHISVDEIKGINDKIGYKQHELDSRSYSVFLQPCFSEEKLTSNSISVINGVLSGYGKYIGRFLPLFRPEVTDYFRNENSLIMGSDIFVEFDDSSYFNANFHPSLMAGHMVISENSPSTYKEKLSIRDIDVVLNDQVNLLELRHRKTNKRVIAFDLGFQGTKGRSAFFKFLSLFTHASIPDFDLIVSTVYNTYEKAMLGEEGWKDQLLVYPRICLEQQIVVTRKKWRIHPNKFPAVRKEHAFEEKLLEIHKWISLHRIPEEFFLSYDPETISGVELSSNDQKPQYINIKNPFLVNLFIKSLSKGTTITIEEMLPSSDQLGSDDDEEKFVTEYLVHWNS